MPFAISESREKQVLNAISFLRRMEKILKQRDTEALITLITVKNVYEVVK